MKKVLFSGCALFALLAFTTRPVSTNNTADVAKITVQNGFQLTAELYGANEVPMSGDPDGSGQVELILNQGQGTISYTIMVEGIQTATAAHIHIGAAGVAGPVVAGLSAPSSGMSAGVIEVDKELIKAIRKNPEMYYVNVHNPTYPGGAVRGQLSK